MKNKTWGFSFFILLTISLLLCASLLVLGLFFFPSPSETYTRYNLTSHYPILSEQAKHSFIKRGEYLAKISNCFSCHTDNKSKGAYSGGRTLHTPFGVFYSSNITPDKKTGIGRWSEQDFIRAMRKGLSPEGKHYFPVFPYPYFSNFTDNDLRALYAYFKAIPAVQQLNPPPSFLFRLPGARALMWLWNKHYLEQYKIKRAKDSANFQGEYLVRSASHCGACHTPLAITGNHLSQHALAGRFMAGYYAPAINKQALSKIAPLNIAQSLLKGHRLSDGSRYAGPMAEVHENSLHYLTQQDSLAIAYYLKTVDSLPSLPFKTTTKPNTLARGKAVYEQVCSVCHNKGKMGAPRIGNAARYQYRIGTQGLQDLYKKTLNGYNRMPALGACLQCSPGDIKAAVDYLLKSSLSKTHYERLSNVLKK